MFLFYLFSEMLSFFCSIWCRHYSYIGGDVAAQHGDRSMYYHFCDYFGDSLKWEEFSLFVTLVDGSVQQEMVQLRMHDGNSIMN